MRLCRLGCSISNTRQVSIKAAPLVAESVSTRYRPIDGAGALRDVQELPNLKTAQNVQFEGLGTPPSALSVSVPPSLPLYYRRNSLLALQANLKGLNLSRHFIKPFSRFLYGNYPCHYERLISTEPFVALVSAVAPWSLLWPLRKNTLKSFAIVTLDGTHDWAVLKRDALQVYAGPSLNIQMQRLPLRISRFLSKHLNVSRTERTGLFSWTRAGYTFVSGRGSLGLVGNGSVYKADIAEGEDMVVNKSNLIGLSANGPKDLQNCCASISFPFTVSNVSVEPPMMPASIKTWSDFVAAIQVLYWKTLSLTTRAKSTVSNTPFLRVVGPRTILIQSVSRESFEKNFRLPNLEVGHSIVGPVAKPKPQVEDYLNIVTVGAEGTAIESTKTFTKN